MIVSRRVLYAHNVASCVQCAAVSGDTETTLYLYAVVWSRNKAVVCKPNIAALLRATAS